MMKCLILQDKDGRDLFTQAVVLLSDDGDMDEARRDAGRCFDEAVKAEPEEWNYGDVVARMKALGYTLLESDEYILNV